MKPISEIEGLICYWKFDENSGTTLYDASLNSNTGRIFNIDEDEAWINGKINKALRLDGTDDYIIIDDLPELDLGKENQSYSISFWVRRNGNPKFEAGIVSKHDGYGAYPFAVTILPSGEVTFSLSDGTNVSKTVSGVVTDDKWHHIAAVRDNADKTLRVYFDGTETSNPGIDETVGDLSNDDQIWISKYIFYIDDASYFHDNFMIDDLRIYDRALSVDDTESLYKFSDSQISFSNIINFLHSLISSIFRF